VSRGPGERHDQGGTPPADEPRRYPLGRGGRQAFADAAGLADEGWRLVDATLSRRDLRVVLSREGVQLTLDLVARPVEPRGAGGHAFTVTRRSPRDEAHEPLVARLQRRLAESPAEGLVATLRRDLLQWTEAGGEPRPDQVRAFFATPYWNDQWWRFLLPSKGALSQQVRLGGRRGYVHHCSRECEASGIIGVALPSTRLFAHEQRSDQMPVRSVWTALDEESVLAGRSLELLERAVVQLAAPGDLDEIDVQSSCVPDLIGDNPGAVARRVHEASGVRVNWNAKTRPEEDTYARLIEQRLAQALTEASSDPRRVLLGGLGPRHPAVTELTALLTALDLEVAGTLFPELPADLAPGPVGALVWANPIGWEWIAPRWLLDHVAVVSTYPPYGLAGTERWLRRVAAVLEVPGGDARVDGLAAGWRQRLEPLRERCARHRLGLVGDRRDLADFVSRDGAFGCSLAEVLVEMGFTIEALVYEPEASPGQAPTWAAAEPPAGLRFTPFATRADLDGLLGSGLSAVFSSFRADPRLAAHGVPSFAEDQLALGVEGLFGMASRLLARCERQAFAGVRRYLAPCLGERRATATADGED